MPNLTSLMICSGHASSGQHDPATGHRIKEPTAPGKVNWVHSILKQRKLLPADWTLSQCLFGEYILSRYPDNKVMLVESEKTALIRYAAANGTLPSNADIADWIISYRQSGNAMFQRNKSTISRHIRNVFESGELNPDSTVAFFATVQNEGNRKVERNIAYYNLDVIISVGYRVNSHRGVQFRIWATQILREYLVKGFAMNDDLLKRAGGGNYFDELREGSVEPQEAYERTCRQAPQGFIVPLETGPRKCFGQLPHYTGLIKYAS